MACRLILLVVLTVLVVACSSTTSLPTITATTALGYASPTPAQPVSTLHPTAPIDISSLTGRIVFTAGPHPQEDIYVINADGSKLTQLTTDPAADYDPSWLPDGTRIAFRSRRDGNDEIDIMNVVGSGQTNLTNHPAMDLSPAWSPDGHYILFVAGGLYVIPVDGSEVIQLPVTGLGEVAFPDWTK